MKTKLFLMKMYVAFLVTIVSTTATFAQWNQVGEGIKGSVDFQQLGRKTVMSGDGNRILVYSLSPTADNIKTGKIQVFDYINNAWSEIFVLENVNDNTTNTAFENRVDISNNGNVIAFSYHKENRVKAVSYKYDNNTNMFTQYGNIIDTNPLNNGLDNVKSIFSISLDADGNNVAISTLYHLNSERYDIVNVYKYENATWMSKGDGITDGARYDNGYGEYFTAHFGNDIDLSGDGNRLLVGERFFRGANTGTLGIGRASVYYFMSNNWTRVGNRIVGNATDTLLGYSVSMSNDGSKIAVSSSKHARVFKLDNVTWQQVGTDLLVRGNVSTSDSAQLLSLNNDGSVIALGNPHLKLTAFNNPGAIAIYQFSSGTWLQRGENLLGENHSERYGWTIAISNNGQRVITSAYGNSDDADNGGKVRVFDNNAVTVTTAHLTHIPGNNFEQALIDLGYDNVLDDYVVTANIENIVSLDISNKNISDITGIKDFISLETLNCKTNALTSLTIDTNTQLKELDCSSNDLSRLDVSNNTQLTALIATNNNQLSCIQVTDVSYATTNWTNQVDAGASFSTDCSDVWTIVVDPTTLTTLSAIPGLDANNDGSITLEEAAAFVGTLDLSNAGISSVEGLQAFTGITTLDISGNSITDLSPLTGLSIDIISKTSGNVKRVTTTTLALENLIISNNNFVSLNLDALTNLKTVDISNNPDLVTVSIKNGNNAVISSFNSSNTPKLTCLLVDNINAAYLSNWTIDATTSFAADATDCQQRVLAVTNEVLEKNFSLYPNPVRDFLMIKSEIAIDAIEVYNAIGKRVVKTTSNVINLSKLSNGIYFVKILAENKVLTKKIIKN